MSNMILARIQCSEEEEKKTKGTSAQYTCPHFPQSCNSPPQHDFERQTQSCRVHSGLKTSFDYLSVLTMTDHLWDFTH